MTPDRHGDEPFPHIAGSVLGEVPPPSLAEFARIQRLLDPKLGRVTAKILPGEYYVTTADELITTVLGSCVAACMWDPDAGVGGMNHFMIPTGSAGSSIGTDAARYGMFAMELLINAILKNGGDRYRLRVKLVGGGNVLPDSTARVGSENVAFARRYLASEGIEIVGEHVEGRNARRVSFDPLTGHSRVLELPIDMGRQPTSIQERAYAQNVRAAGPGPVELF